MTGQSTGIILLYHRVTDIPTDPQLLAVGPRNFSRHLEVLGLITRPMPLREMIRRARESSLLPNSVALTFDDGYADNLLEAKPLLQRCGIPATVYVATAGIGRAHEFFSDELDRIFLQPGAIPPQLKLNVGDRTYESTHAAAATYTRQQWDEYRPWNVLEPADPTDRQRLYREVCKLLYSGTTAQRRAALAELQKWAGLKPEGRRSHRMLTADEVRELAAGGIVEVGAHTDSHPLLPAETIEQQRHEIAQSKATLESILGHPVPGFSYPFGTRRDYTPETVQAVRDAGFEYACSNFAGKVSAETDVYQLPRFIVRDWDATTFRQKLQEYLNWVPKSKAA